jgi:CelD/BcsL family acetyltransferase involved in cellulose biosynthesis
MITINKIDTVEDWMLLKEQWNEVLEKSPTPFPFLSYQWLSSWWHAFGTGKKLYLVLIFDNDELIGFAPLMQWKTQIGILPIRKLSFLANEHSPRADFIFSKNSTKCLQLLWTYLLAHRADWDEIELNDLPSQTEMIPWLQSNSWVRWAVIPSIRSPYVQIAQDWDSYYQTRSKKLRDDLRKKWNKLAQKGTIQVNQITRISPDKPIMDILFAVANKSWKAQQGTAISSTPELRQFYSEIAYHLSELGWLSLWQLEVDHQPIAYYYNVRYRNTEYSLKTYHDPSYDPFSPGRLLVWQVLREAFNQPDIKIYEFLGVPERFKLEWADQLMLHHTVFLYHNGFIATIRYICKRIMIGFVSVRHRLGAFFPGAKKVYFTLRARFKKEPVGSEKNK